MLHRLKEMSWDVRKTRGIKEKREERGKAEREKRRSRKQREKKDQKKREKKKKKGRRRLHALSRRRLYGCPRAEEKREGPGGRSFSLPEASPCRPEAARPGPAQPRQGAPLPAARPRAAPRPRCSGGNPVPAAARRWLKRREASLRNAGFPRPAGPRPALAFERLPAGRLVLVLPFLPGIVSPPRPLCHRLVPNHSRRGAACASTPL